MSGITPLVVVGFLDTVLDVAGVHPLSIQGKDEFPEDTDVLLPFLMITGANSDFRSRGTLMTTDPTFEASSFGL